MHDYLKLSERVALKNLLTDLKLFERFIQELLYFFKVI
jgi:hypothetical protein